MATLTYVHADQTAVVGPLATYAEPHTYDLCAEHAMRLSAPRGWQVVRLAVDLHSPPAPEDDLLAIADAVSSGPIVTAAAAASPTTEPPRRPGPPRLSLVRGN